MPTFTDRVVRNRANPWIPPEHARRKAAWWIEITTRYYRARWTGFRKAHASRFGFLTRLTLVRSKHDDTHMCTGLRGATVQLSVARWGAGAYTVSVAVGRSEARHEAMDSYYHLTRERYVAVERGTGEGYYLGIETRLRGVSGPQAWSRENPLVTGDPMRA